jgi:LysM repeat protein
MTEFTPKIVKVDRRHTTGPPVPNKQEYEGIYVVKPGDTLTKVAFLFETSTKKIQQLNDLSNTTILAGM